MNSKLLASLLCLLALVAAPGCSKHGQQEEAVRSYFDRALRGESSLYKLGGVTGYVVRSYELVRMVDKLAVVQVTFASKAGTDLVKTKRFSFDERNRLVPLDPEDIREGIKINLAFILVAATDDKTWREKATGDKVSYRTLFPDGGYGLKSTRSIAGEDYMDTELIGEGPYLHKARLAFPAGEVVEVGIMEAMGSVASP